VQSTFSSRIEGVDTTKVSETVGMTSFEPWWNERHTKQRRVCISIPVPDGRATAPRLGVP